MMGAPTTPSNEEENVNSFFTEFEKDLCRQFCGLVKKTKDIAIQLKQSLIARGILQHTTSYEQVINETKFMKMVEDLIILNLEDDVTKSKYGKVEFKDKFYEIVSNFELADPTKKPKDYAKKVTDLGLEMGVYTALMARRSSLSTSIRREKNNLVFYMDFPETPKKQPAVAKTITKADVIDRVEAFMVKK